MKDRSRNPKVAIKVFQWVAGAKRPLTINEMTEAISIRPDDKTWEEVAQRCPMDEYKVLENCANLITLNNDGTIQFAHSTVLDYLSSQHLIPQDCQQFKIDQDTLNTRLAHICITYLSFPGFEQSVPKRTARVVKCTPLSGQDIGEQIPLMLRRCSTVLERGIGNTAAQYARFRTPSLTLARADLERIVQSAPEVTVPSTAARYIMLNYIAENWWKYCSKVDTLEQAIGEDWTSKLDDLCFHRKFPVPHLPWLLSVSGDSSLKAEDEFEIPFTWAVDSDHEALQHFIMSKLHRLGLPPTTPMLWTRKNLEAVTNRSTHIQVYIIVTPDVWFSIPTRLHYRFPDPLLVATCRGYTKVCQKLLEGIRSTIGSLESELELEAMSRSRLDGTAGELVRRHSSEYPSGIMIAHGILSVACELGHVKIVQLCLQFDAVALIVMQTTSQLGMYTVSTNIGDEDRVARAWTPTELALANGHLDIIKVLLLVIEKEKARIKGQEGLGTAAGLTYLDLATGEAMGQVPTGTAVGFQPVLDRVFSNLSHGINLQSVMSGLTLSASQARLTRGLVDFISFDPYRCLDRHCPTMARLRSRFQKNNGAKLRNNHFLWDAPTWKAAALLSASATGRVDAVKRILGTNAIASDRGDSIHQTNSPYPARLLKFVPGLPVIDVNLGLYPLLVAFAEGWDAVVKLLLTAGGRTLRDVADSYAEKVITGDKEICSGKNMLHIAAEKGHMKMVEVLLQDNHIDVNCPDTEGNTPLYYAILNGKLDVAKILRATGTDTGRHQASLPHPQQASASEMKPSSDSGSDVSGDGPGSAQVVAEGDRAYGG